MNMCVIFVTLRKFYSIVKMTHTIFARSLAIIILQLLFISATAQLASEGTWAASQTISNTQTINLTGNVTISGRVTITGNLTINNATGGDVYIYGTAAGGAFDIHDGGILTLNGAEGKRIILDGGMNYTWDAENYKLTTTQAANTKWLSFVTNTGTLNANYVTWQNCDTNHSGGGKGALRVESKQKTNLSNCIFQNNKGLVGVGILVPVAVNAGVDVAEQCAITLNKCEFRHNEATGIHESIGYSGIIRVSGAGNPHIYMNECVMEENYVAGSGTICFLGAQPGAKLTLNGCSFKNNRAGMHGGAMLLVGSTEFITNTTTVEGNTAVKDGGGIYVPTYNGLDAEGLLVTRELNFSDQLVVQNNTAGAHGGGIAFEFTTSKFAAGSTVHTNVNGATITKNTAAERGGGIYFYKDPSLSGYTFDLKLNYGSITNNKAKNGGGIAVFNATVYANDEAVGHTLTVADNEAIYSSGGGNGGGTFIQNGVLTLSDALIQRNKAFAGAGIFVYSDAEAYSNSTFSGGKFFQNEASRAGGGFAAYGNVNVTLSNADIQENTAPVAGGIYICNGAHLTFDGGLITRNKAVGTNTQTTAYYKPLAEIVGVGGGIFLDSDSQMDFNVATNFGIYDNKADMAADDIFAIGLAPTNLKSTLNLPKVASMSLDDYPMPVSHLYWVEDYFTGDTQYTQGTNKKTSTAEIKRYRDALADPINSHFFTLNEDTDWSGTNFSLNQKYICVALGYSVVNAVISKSGLKPGESAIFTVTLTGQTEPYTTVVLTGKEGETTVSQGVLLSGGSWTVAESPWSWTYTSTSPASITKIVTADDYTFSFTNTPKDGTPPHAEAKVTNVIE